MKLLALDTASASQSVGLFEDDRIVAIAGASSARGDSERILLLVERVLELAGHGLSTIDAVSVSRGPGSLTGLRVGIGTARGIALGAGKPLYGVSTLQALAAALGAGPLVLALLDAGRHEVYGGLFRPGSPPRPIGRERVGPPQWFAEAVAGKSVRIAGNGAARYRDLFPEASFTPALGEEFLAAGVGRVAAACTRGGTEPGGGGSLVCGGEGWEATPVYLRREPPPVRFEE